MLRHVLGVGVVCIAVASQLSAQKIRSVSAGHFFIVALNDQGTVRGWGQNDDGELGDGTHSDHYTATTVNGLSGVVAVSGGGYHTLALTSDGRVWAWGDNSHGQLGDGTTTSRATPAVVANAGPAIAVAAGYFYSMVLRSDGTVVAWGSNSLGQLGDGTNSDRFTPVSVSGLSNVTALAAGINSAMALRSDGTVVAWGSNTLGQLGDGTTNDHSSPAAVRGLGPVSRLAAGGLHALAVLRDGTVWAWGFNASGQLGDGTTTSQPTPVQVRGLTGVSTVAGGLDHSVALKTDGTVWAWGANYSGQIGNGTNVRQPAPLQVANVTGVVSLTAGTDFTSAVQSDGTVWGWGGNFYGTLSDSTAGDRWWPARAVLTPTPTAITIGAITPDPGGAGQPYTVPFTVTSGLGPVIQGPVTVSDGNGASCTALLPITSCRLTSTSGGFKQITASYAGDGGSLTGSSASKSFNVIMKATPNLVISSISPEPSVAGQPFTVSVSLSSSAGTPTGTVQINAGGATCNITVTAGGGSCALRLSALGTATVSAAYSGDGTFGPLNASATHMVVPTSSGGQGGNSTGLTFIPMSPCRLVETRADYNFQGRTGSFGPPFVRAGETRTLTPQASNVCSVPASAKAYVLNVTLIPKTQVDFVTLWPAGEAQPNVWTVRSPDGQIVANSAIVKAGTSGAISLYTSNDTDLLVDIAGYFADATTPGGLVYYPLTPCRVLDTRSDYRSPAGPFGPPSLNSGETRHFRFPSTPYCSIPQGASAYSVTLTVVPPQQLPYLTAWPSGTSQPNVSSINSFAGRTLANNLVIPASADGSIDVFAFAKTDMLIDITGYFAPDNGAGLYYFPVTQCRVLDTRSAPGAYGGPALPANASRSVGVPSSLCAGVPTSALGYALTATVIPGGTSMPFLTLWPTGTSQPNASTLNAFEGQTVSASAIIPASAGGSIDVLAFQRTNVVLDLSGYFGR